MSAWQNYKAKLGTTRPWDLLNPNAPKAEEQVSEARYAICLECPELIKVTKQCKQCGCVMPGKVKLLQATCPLNKW
jgi:hypothetical protein